MWFGAAVCITHAAPDGAWISSSTFTIDMALLPELSGISWSESSSDMWNNRTKTEAQPWRGGLSLRIRTAASDRLRSSSATNWRSSSAL